MGYSSGSKYGRGRGRSYGGDGSRGFNRGSPSPKPVEVGKEYDVDITEISRQGDGIARIKGFVVFVQNGKIGNNIKVKIVQVGDKSAKATIIV
jgi:predicted RNA-binding protein with TRAM domain